MTALYALLVVGGFALCGGSLVWAFRARRARRLWHASHHTDTVAIVLELEERVRAAEAVTATRPRGQ